MYENLVRVGLLGHHRDINSLCLFHQFFNGECFPSIFFLRTLRCRNMFHLYHLDVSQSMTTGRYAFACALATTQRKHCLELFKGQTNMLLILFLCHHFGFCSESKKFLQAEIFTSRSISLFVFLCMFYFCTHFTQYRKFWLRVY